LTAAGPPEDGAPDLASARVLIVDPSRSARSMLERFMRWAGVGQMDFSGDGTDALRRLERFRPDVVFTEATLPNIDGLELCRRLRADPAFGDVPVIFQTEISSDQGRIACFEAGASDVMAKPLVYAETVSRLRLHLDKRRMVQALREFRARVEQDLVSARSMQLSLVPDAARFAPLCRERGLDIAAVFEPSTELGGDFWSVFPHPGGGIGLLVADFSGHGIPAAINTFRLHTLIESLPPGDRSPAEWLARLAADLKDLLRPGQFATAFYGVIDPVAKTLTYASAGHPGPILDDGTTARILEGAGLFLGIVKDATYEDLRVDLPDRWALLAYSDALLESPDRFGRMLGEEGAAALVRQVRSGGDDRSLDRLVDLFHAPGRRPLDDDLTLVWVSKAEAG
jgi:phosphoserine phosphatase RsbU/P